MYTYPAVDARTMENPQSLLAVWRQERSARVGRTLFYAGAVLALLATGADIKWGHIYVVISDLFLLGGCLSSVLYLRRSHPPHYWWWPAYLGVWLTTLPSLWTTGGFNSPFFGLYLALLYVIAVVMDAHGRWYWPALFTALQLPALAVLMRYFPVDSVLPIPVEMTLVITAVSLIAVIVCVQSMLRTERELATEFSLRYHELSSAKLELQREEASNVAKNTFLANVSHELRTPLAAILGYLDLMNEPALTENEKSVHIETVRRNSHQLLHLVNDLLDLSKIEAGKVNIASARARLQEILNEVFAVTDLLAKKKNLPVSFRYQNKVPEYIETDTTRLKQILLNIIGNAIKFTEKGRVDLLIQFKDHDDGGELLFTVMDTGRGLSPEEQTRLFKPFSQVDPSLSRKYGGTGLGLSLSHKLANLLGGQLELAHSQKGSGSVFQLRLPVPRIENQTWVDAFVPMVTPIADAPEIENSTSGLGANRILVVDDTLDSQKLIATYLSALGAHVDVAGDGLEALSKAKNSQFDLILMDIQMPRMDGLEATAALRQQGFAKQILALTAHAMQEDLERCMAAGCDGYLTKPISKQVLLESVERALSAAR